MTITTKNEAKNKKQPRKPAVLRLSEHHPLFLHPVTIKMYQTDPHASLPSFAHFLFLYTPRPRHEEPSTSLKSPGRRMNRNTKREKGEMRKPTRRWGGLVGSLVGCAAEEYRYMKTHNRRGFFSLIFLSLEKSIHGTPSSPPNQPEPSHRDHHTYLLPLSPPFLPLSPGRPLYRRGKR